jgi:fungal STAND N-terminal Goodbye domain
MTSSSANPLSTLDRAFHDYFKTTGIDLTSHPSVNKFQNCRSPDDVVQQLPERETASESDRGKYRDLIDRLLPVVQIICGFSGVVDGVADLVSSDFSYLIISKFSPQVPLQLSKAILVAIDVLLSVRMASLLSFWSYMTPIHVRRLLILLQVMIHYSISSNASRISSHTSVFIPRKYRCPLRCQV